ncbi:MAG TPA: ABC-F family ATP-binding cassette domain-containing protein [Ktedonobacteraceae bacterium]|nr:ABC-F family ATP-binding cassette domain-containing protein [Ktedonobacteraceae bacterium]
MLLAGRQLAKSYGAITVLNDVSFVINAADRVGLVGPNGVGKSTLLRLLVGQEEADGGAISYAPSVESGYLPQTTPEFYGYTIQDLILESVGNLRQLEERMRQLETAMASADETQLPALLAEYQLVSTRFQDRGGYELDYKIDVILEGLRIAYLPRTQEVQSLSGGEKTRVGLATLLLRSPDLLFMDEPTNHLDFATLEWLERYLSGYRGAMLIVSHDRQFLNRAVNRIFEISDHDHQLKAYEGNYNAYVQAKAAERVKWEEDYERQQQEIVDLRKRIKVSARQVGHGYRPPRDNDKNAIHFFEQRVQSTISRNIRAAEEQLRRIEAAPIPKPPELLKVSSRFTSEPMQSQAVLTLSQVAKAFGARCILRDVNLTLKPRARIVLTGPNGTGKTTLLRIIMGLEQPDAGSVQVVAGARIGYLPQEGQTFDLHKTVIETYRYGQIGYEGEFIARLIGYGLFRLEDMHKKVGQLSPGQRRKLEIARLMANEPNVLLLDEPTNYISLDVLEAFEAAVLAFPGPVVVISHDRWFIERFGGELWEIAGTRLVKQGERLLEET